VNLQDVATEGHLRQTEANNSVKRTRHNVKLKRWMLFSARTHWT